MQSANGVKFYEIVFAWSAVKILIIGVVFKKVEIHFALGPALTSLTAHNSLKQFRVSKLSI